MEDCVFCKIVARELPAHRVWEDENHLAFLDIYPVRTGQVVVVTKDHLDSYVLGLPEWQLTGLFLAAAAVATKLNKALGIARSSLVMEGLGVGHAHVKLYPVRVAEGEGGLVRLGKKADESQLNELATKIRGEG